MIFACFCNPLATGQTLPANNIEKLQWRRQIIGLEILLQNMAKNVIETFHSQE